MKLLMAQNPVSPVSIGLEQLQKNCTMIRDNMLMTLAPHQDAFNLPDCTHSPHTPPMETALCSAVMPSLS